MANNKSGPRGAWNYGGLGAILWIPVMGIIFLFHENYLGTSVCAFFMAGGMLYLYVFAPWKYPDASIGFLYAGLVVIIIFAAISIFLAWYSWKLDHGTITRFDMEIFLPILIIIIFNLFLPVLLLAQKTWNDLS